MLAASVLLRFFAHCSGGLSADGCHGDGRDLVDDVHRLHDGGGATRRRYDGRRRHGVGHRLHGRLRHLALHGDQHWLVVEGGAYQRAGWVTVPSFTNVNTTSMSLHLYRGFLYHPFGQDTNFKNVMFYQGSFVQSGPLG